MKKELTNLDWYKLIIWAYSKLNVYGNVHKHHIKPKCLYPDLAEDEKNIINVPAIVHWALHKLLFKHYEETNNKEATSKLQHVDIETFINDGQKNYARSHSNTSLYDFSKADEIIELIKNAVHKYVLSRLDYEDSLNARKHYEKTVLKHKKVRDMTDEEKQTRAEFNKSEKQCYDYRYVRGQVLRNINDTVLSKFGIKITDELDKFDDDDVRMLVILQDIAQDGILDDL